MPTRPSSGDTDRSRSVRIEAPSNFDFEWASEFLAARTVPSLEAVSPGEYWRSTRVEGQPVTLGIRYDSGADGRGGLWVRSAPLLRSAELKKLVVRMFDLDADLEGFLARAQADPVLRDILASRPGIRLPQFLDPFEGAVRAVLGQQVSVAAASTMTDRVVQLFGDDAPDLDGRVFRAFPRPESIVMAGVTELGALGLTRAKASTLCTLAEAALSGALDWEVLRRGTPADAQAKLLSLRGIGPWTASYIRMRALGDRDAFPVEDLGVTKAVRLFLPGGESLGRSEILELAEAWRPWRAYATLHLWRALAGQGAFDQARGGPAPARGRVPLPAREG